ncbi:MAG: efflux RND transporter periplasmic adaptor subunit [Pseudomonadota bacterium]
MNKRQTIIVAAIVALTAAAGVAVWTMGGTSKASGEEHGHAAGHDDAEHHAGEGQEKGKPPATAASGKPAEAEEHGHEAGEGEHKEGEAEGDADTVRLSAAQLQASGVKLAKAEAGAIRSGAEFPAEVRLNADRTAQVAPRVPGVVTAVPANLGQSVRKGDVLAVISSAELSNQRAALLAARERAGTARATFAREKRLWEQKISAEQDYLQAQQALREAEIEQRNAEQRLLAVGASLGSNGPEGLSRYEIRAPFDGSVVEKKLSLGESVAGESMVFLVSDLSAVWVEANIPAKDLEKVQVGMAASIQAPGSTTVVPGKVSYVGSLLGAQTRTAVARVTLTTPNKAWRPGLFVNVRVLSEQANAAVTVRNDALQIVEDKPSVFVRTAEGFQVRHLKLGRTDGTLSEVLEGLQAGQEYAAVNSFVLKAELGKGSAEHAH